MSLRCNLVCRSHTQYHIPRHRPCLSSAYVWTSRDFKCVLRSTVYCRWEYITSLRRKTSVLSIPLEHGRPTGKIFSPALHFFFFFRTLHEKSPRLWSTGLHSTLYLAYLYLYGVERHTSIAIVSKGLHKIFVILFSVSFSQWPGFRLCSVNCGKQTSCDVCDDWTRS